MMKKAPTRTWSTHRLKRLLKKPDRSRQHSQEWLCHTGHQQVTKRVAQRGFAANWFCAADMLCSCGTGMPVLVFLWGRDSSLPPAFQPACSGTRNRRGAQRNEDLVVQAFLPVLAFSETSSSCESLFSIQHKNQNITYIDSAIS